MRVASGSRVKLSSEDVNKITSVDRESSHDILISHSNVQSKILIVKFKKNSCLGHLNLNIRICLEIRISDFKFRI